MLLREVDYTVLNAGMPFLYGCVSTCRHASAFVLPIGDTNSVFVFAHKNPLFLYEKIHDAIAGINHNAEFWLW
jgi:hypothetical protein